MKRIIRLAYTLFAAALLMTACDIKEEPFIEGAEDAKAIERFDVDTIVGMVDEAMKTVTLSMPVGTDVTSLVPTIEVSTYASVEPASGVAQDFSEPVYYTVTAFNGTTAQYVVSVEFDDGQNEKQILSFTVDVPTLDITIDEFNKMVTLLFPEGADVTHVVPTIEISEGATISPASGVAQDFTEPVEYTVTALNGSTVTYTVTAIVGMPELAGKTVLVKDFTGSRCVNCPGAADYAHSLQHQLGEDRIFILSVHAGSLAQPVGQFPDFTTDEGTLWYNNNSSNPLFAVDHVSLSEGNTLFVEQIDAPVSECLAEQQSFEIGISTTYDEATRQLDVASQLMAVSDSEGDYHVTVCLVEDNIVGRQVTPSGLDTEYVFRNVFRGTLNGADGIGFHSGAVADGEMFNVSYSTELNADYNADECYVMVYIHDKSNGDKVVQTAMKKIK